MESNLYLTTGPSEEPISVAEAKRHGRIDIGDEDTLLQEVLIPAARQWGEATTGRAFCTQTWTLKLPYFPCGEIVLPKPPLVSVTSIKYLDTSGVEQTWATNQYIVTAPSGEYPARGKIQPAYSVVYPATQSVTDAVRILFVAGYGAATAVPQGIKAALALHVAEAYVNRERPDYSLAEGAIWPWVELRFD